MKFTKLIPLAMAAMLVSPAFAATSVPVELSITVPTFFNIVDESTNKSVSGTITGTAGDTLTLSAAMTPAFRVYTNYTANTVKLSATAPLSSGTAAALYGSESAPKLVFTNTKSGSQPASGSVTDITGGTSSASGNPNAIAFAFTPSVALVPGTGPDDNIGAAYATNVITYTMKNGQYTFSYEGATTPEDKTFSTMDESGTYKCNVTLAQYIAP